LPPSATTPPASAAAPSVSRSATSGGLVPSSTAINLGGFSRLADAQSMNGVTINVNAPSAIDEEGFTRAVVSALNNTGRRTGAGTEQLAI